METLTQRSGRPRLVLPSLSLTRRMLLWVIPLALAGIFLSTIPLYRAARKQILDGVRRDIDGSAAAAARSIQSYSEARLNDLEAVAESPLLIDYYKNMDYELFEEAEAYRLDIASYLLRFSKRTKAFDAILYLDSDGAAVARAQGGGRTGAPRIDPALFKLLRAMAPGRRYRSKIEGGAHPLWTIAKPLHDAAGGFRGAVVMAVNLGPVKEDLNRRRTGKGASAALVDRSGKTLLGTAAPAGGDMLVSLYPVSGTDWRVRTAARMADFLGPLEDIRDLTLWLSLSCALAVVILFFIRVRSLTAPVNDLVEAAHRYGEGELAHRVPVRGGDEIAALAAQFNAMAENIQHRSEQLEARVRELASLKDLSDAVMNRSKRDEIARVCLRSAVQGLGFDRGGLFLVDEAAGALRGSRTHSAAASPFGDAEIARLQYPLAGGGILAWVVREKRPANVLDAAADPRCDPEAVRGTRKAFCAAPVMAEDRVYAVIVVDNPQSGAPITEEQVRTLSLFCNAAGLAFKNRELFKSIRRSESRYRTVVNSSSDAIIGLDAELRATVWSLGAERIFGFTGSEILGRTLERLFAPGEYRRLVRLALEKGPLTNFDIAGRTRAGKRLDLSLAWAGSGAGPPAGREWALVIRDVTAEKSLRAHLLEVEKLSLTGRLLSGVAHELNNPLTNVIGYSEILAQEEAPAGMREDLNQILDNARRCAAIVDNLLLFVRRPRARKRRVSLRKAVRASLRLLDHDLRRERIRVRRRLEKGLPHVLGNLQQFEQVLVNIIENACRAMAGDKEEKMLEIAARRDGGWVELEIGDSGPGVPEAKRTSIFDPFFTTREDGTGLGLAICSQIIRDHGGTIGCGGSPLGGALFRIRLPAAAERARREKAERARPLEPGCGVLVVEDEAATLALIRRYLLIEGHTVGVARSGQEALKLLSAGRFDLVIADLHVGRINGRQVLAAAARRKNPPALLLTTGDIGGAEASGKSSPSAVPILRKPFTLRRFQNAVRKALRDARVRR